MKRKNKDESIAAKIYHIAEMVGDLNAANKVKRGVQNNFGHATIVKIAPGCNIRVHHMFDNTLSLDLLISPSAQSKYFSKCETAKSKFVKIYSKRTLENKNFIIPSRKDEPHYRSWIDLTNYSVDELNEVIDNMNKSFS